MRGTEREDLRLIRGILIDPALCSARHRLLSDVLDIEAKRLTERWTSFAWFDAAERCIGNVDATRLSLTSDGATLPIAAIRYVAVDPDFRERGLFRDLMEEALDWCSEQAPLTLLYTDNPPLYTSFGFRIIEQHAFVCRDVELNASTSSTNPNQAGQVRKLDLFDLGDLQFARALVERRAPLSRKCALNVSFEVIMDNVVKDPDLVLVFAAALDALIVYEGGNNHLTLVDLVATRMPEFGAVLETLGIRPKSLKVMFPPDQIGWQGTSVIEHTGLMARGVLPDSMSRPFMFPPTVEF